MSQGALAHQVHTVVFDAEPEITREGQLWEKAIDRLQDGEDPDAQLTMLRLFAKLDDGFLPIPEIVDVLLTETSSEGTLFFGESDDMWTEELAVVERMPELVPVEHVVAVVRRAFQEGEDDAQQQLLALLCKIAGYVEEQTFLALLQDDDPLVRCAGVEACYSFRLKAPLPTMLDDDDPRVRALAIENTYFVGVFDRVKVQAMADNILEDAAVRNQARVYLAKAAEQLRLVPSSHTAS